VAGLSADRQRQHRTGYENFIGSALGVRGRLRRDQIDVVQNVDQFAQAWWQWSPRWSLLAGVRHSAVRFDRRSLHHGATRMTVATGATRRPRRWQASASRPARSGGCTPPWAWLRDPHLQRAGLSRRRQAGWRWIWRPRAAAAWR
jgi:iron complex outermembrane receptor protein